MRDELRELWRYRELLLTFVIRDLRVRYKNSVLGFFWSLLNPLATVLVMTVVFKYIVGITTRNYSAYLFAAYLPWTFFQMTLLDSSQSILLHMPLIKKIYFPREILPLSAVLSNLVHFLLAMVVFFLFLGGVWVANPGMSPFTIHALWVPLLTIPFVLLTAGFALIVASMNTFYEDTKYILSVGLYLMFFLTPVIYFSESVAHAGQIPPEYQHTVYVVYHLNPVSEYVSTYRKLLLKPQVVERRAVGEPMAKQQPMPIDPGLLATAVGVSLVAFLGGYAYFNRRKWEFVERP